MILLLQKELLKILKIDNNNIETNINITEVFNEPFKALDEKINSKPVHDKKLLDHFNLVIGIRMAIKIELAHKLNLFKLI